MSAECTVWPICPCLHKVRLKYDAALARTHVFQPDYSVQPVPPGETMTHVIIKPGQPSPELHILGLVNIEN